MTPEERAANLLWIRAIISDPLRRPITRADAGFILSELDGLAEYADTLQEANKALGDDYDVNMVRVRNDAIKEAARVARAYEPRCESCPRGVESAILHLLEHPASENPE